MAERKWSVSVHVDGKNVLHIESDCLSGVGDVEDYREQIIDAADNLIAFIGREPSEFIVPEQPQ